MATKSTRNSFSKSFEPHRYYHQLQWDKYEPHLVKRIKAWALKIINYERPYYDRREISHHEMKKLALEIKKMSQIQRLELTSPEFTIF